MMHRRGLKRRHRPLIKHLTDCAASTLSAPIPLLHTREFETIRRHPPVIRDTLHHRNTLTPVRWGLNVSGPTALGCQIPRLMRMTFRNTNR